MTTTASGEINPFEREELFRRLDLIANAFSPATPITTRELFRGRAAQLGRLLEVSSQRGQHALVYGDRGVGKTSLARVVHGARDAKGTPCGFYTCASGDTFGTIWSQVLDEISFSIARPGVGFGAHDKEIMVTASQMIESGEPTPADIRRVLELVGRIGPTLITIDEFDRPAPDLVAEPMADLIKVVSDNAVPVTINLVGVGSSVTELMREHASIGRSLIQIQMPLMNDDEAREIVTGGMADAEMSVDEAFVETTVGVAQGIPHYIHLVAQHGARVTVESGLTHVQGSDVSYAIELAMEDVSQTLREAYHRATSSNRDTIYEEVLIACAIAAKDDVGEFGSADARDTLNSLTGRAYQIPAISHHLNAFSSGPDSERGGILHKRGKARFKYRFVDPLMPPYVRMKALDRGFDLL